MKLSKIINSRTIGKEDPSELVGIVYNHLPDIEEDPLEFSKYDLNSLTDIGLIIKNKYYKEHGYARYTRIAVVEFKENPVMVIINSGKDGDNYFKRYIISENKYLELRKHILACKKVEDDLLIHETSVNFDLEELDIIKGNYIEFKD